MDRLDPKDVLPITPTAACRKWWLIMCPTWFKIKAESKCFRPPEIPAVLEDPVVVDIAKIHNKTPAQVLLRHLIQQNVIVIPKSGSQNRIRENIDVI